MGWQRSDRRCHVEGKLENSTAGYCVNLIFPTFICNHQTCHQPLAACPSLPELPSSRVRPQLFLKVHLNLEVLVGQKKTAAPHITKLVRGRRKRKRNSYWIYASAGGTNKFPGTEKTNFSAAAGAPTSDVMEANNAFLEEYRIIHPWGIVKTITKRLSCPYLSVLRGACSVRRIAFPFAHVRALGSYLVSRR